MRRILLSFICYCCIVSSSHSQSVAPSVINNAGGTFNYPSRNLVVDWSFGEMTLVNQLQSNAGNGIYVLTNGFLQPYINKPGSVDNTSSFGSEEIKIYPNPAVKFVEIDISTKQRGTFYMSLYNQLGQRIYYRTFYTYGLDRIEKIKLDNLAAGPYMLYIKLDAIAGSVSKEGSFTILKTH